jgi:hypothetical protein
MKAFVEYFVFVADTADKSKSVDEMVAIVMGDDKCEFLESDWRGPNFD